MIKVLFDYQHFSEQRYGGISRYFANIMHEINSRDDISYQLGALYSKNYYISNFKLLLTNKIGEKLLGNKPKREIKWNRRYSKYLVGQGNYDVFHPTYYNPYFLENIKKPFVVTVHDMIHEKFPEVFSPGSPPIALWKKELVGRADKVIAISESTKNDLMAILNTPEEKIEVIYHGVAIKDFPMARSPFILDIPTNFILYVGDRNPYKNFDRFAEAASLVMEQDPELFLICTGGARFNKPEIELLTRLNIIHRCIRLNVTDEELDQLYQHTRAFVFPSLYEGFGFPVLEAFQNCCPVICSNTSSLPEVAGNAAQYFDPLDVNDMAKAIDKVLEDEILCAQLIENGKQRLMDFPIQKCVDQIIEVYKQLI